MKKKIFKFIYVIFHFYLSREERKKPTDQNNYMLVKSNNEQCMCCKIPVRVSSHCIVKHGSFFDNILQKYSKNNTTTQQNNTTTQRNFESYTISNGVITEGSSINKDIEKKRKDILLILDSAAKWNKKLTSDQMKEFQSLWITDSLYPKGYNIILSKFFHDICFYKLRIEYLTDQSKKLNDLVLIIKSEDLSEIIRLSSKDTNKIKALENFILNQPASNELNELMNEARPYERCNSLLLTKLWKKHFADEADSFPRRASDFIVCSNTIAGRLNDKITMAWKKIIKNLNISLGFEDQFFKSIKNESENLKSRISLAPTTISKLEDMFAILFHPSDHKSLKFSLNKLFKFTDHHTSFALLIFIFDRFFENFKNHEIYQDLEKIIGNQSIFYIILSFSDLNAEYKQLLADFYPAIETNHDLVSTSKFILHFILCPLELTELTLLMNFKIEKAMNSKSDKRKFEIKIFNKEPKYSIDEIKCLVEREVEAIEILKITNDLSCPTKNFGPKKNNPRNLACKYSPIVEITGTFIEKVQPDPVQNEFIKPSDNSLTHTQNSLSSTQKQAPISQQLNKHFNHKFNQEESQLISKLKFKIPMGETVNNFEHLLWFIEACAKAEVKAKIETETKTKTKAKKEAKAQKELNVELDVIFKLDDEDQTIMFYFLISYYRDRGSFPKGHYKLCVMHFKNIFKIKFENMLDFINAWFSSILCETSFIENMYFIFFLHNIILMNTKDIGITDNSNAYHPFNFELFLKSANVSSLKAFLFQVENCLTDLMQMCIYFGYEPESIESLEAFQSVLNNKIKENIFSAEPLIKQKRKKIRKEKGETTKKQKRTTKDDNC